MRFPTQSKTILSIIAFLSLFVWALHLVHGSIHRPASIECVVRGDAHYCVYVNSLCYDHKDGLIVLTSDTGKRGKRVRGSNDLASSPLHIPVLATQAFSVVLPHRSFFDGAIFQTRAPSSAFWYSGWSLLASFDDHDGYNFFHWVTKLSVAFMARFYEVEGFGRIRGDSGLSLDALRNLIDGKTRGFSSLSCFAHLQQNGSKVTQKFRWDPTQDFISTRK